MPNLPNFNFDYSKLDRLNQIVTALKLSPFVISPTCKSCIEPIWEYRLQSPIHSISDETPHAQLTLSNELDSDNVTRLLKEIQIAPRQVEDLNETGKPAYYRVRFNINEMEKLTMTSVDYLVAIVAIIDETRGTKALPLAIADTLGTRAQLVNNMLNAL